MKAAAGDISADVDRAEYVRCASRAYPAGGIWQLTWRGDAYLATVYQVAARLSRRSTRLSGLPTKDRYASQTGEIGPSASRS